ncbi:MAG: hypothetical protein ACD_15C00034G0006 [uncultured bacterium]|nr:MAG: hypothetical protein ACD_15C00034G0006 [uncultured bacterium]
MTQHRPCGCSHIQEEENSEEHACCGGGHCHSEEDMQDECGCGHDHGHCHELSPEDMKKLKDAILEAGYKMEESPDGDIKIIENK